MPSNLFIKKTIVNKLRAITRPWLRFGRRQQLSFLMFSEMDSKVKSSPSYYLRIGTIHDKLCLISKLSTTCRNPFNKDFRLIIKILLRWLVVSILPIYFNSIERTTVLGIIDSNPMIACAAAAAQAAGGARGPPRTSLSGFPGFQSRLR